MSKKLHDQDVRDFITGDIDPETLSIATFTKAGAGAGKTFSIKNRILNLIIQKNLSPKNMVIITYTVKAAEELETRIREIIEESIKDKKYAEHKEKLELALNEIPQARISTVHSFCRDLLVEYPVEFLIDPHSDILDGTGTKIFHDACQTEFYKHYLLEEGEFYENNIKSYLDFERLDDDGKCFEYFISLYDNRDLSPVELNFDYPNRKADEAELWQLFNEFMDYLRDLDAQIKDDSDALYQSAPALLAYADEVKTVADIFSAPFDGITKFNKKSGSQAKYQDKDWIKALKEVKVNLREKYDKFQMIINAEKYTLFISAYKAYEKIAHTHKVNNGMIDFFDCLLKVNTVLKENDSLREMIQKQFDIFIIDEFQDSDPIQVEIAYQLSQDNPHKLFFVGDGKQSIFGFARADIEVFRGVEQTVTKEFEGVSKELTTNFRSNKTILDFINTEFSNVLSKSYVPMHVSESKEKDPGIVQIIDIDANLGDDEPEENLKKGGGLRAEIKRDREAYLVCNKIQQIIKSKKYAPEDFLILFRTGTAMEAYEKTFEKLGIPVSNSKSKDYLAREEAGELITLFGYLIHPNEAFYQLALSETSLCGGEVPSEITTIAESENSFKIKVRNAIKSLGIYSFSFTTNDSTYLEIMEYLLEILDIELALTEGSITHAFANMQKRSNTSGYNYGEESDERVNYDKLKKDSIRLMTIHSSKGLEARCVFIVAHDSKPMGIKQFIDRKKNEIFVSNSFLNADAMKIFGHLDLLSLMSAKEESRLEEERRVLYVGLTRAADELYIVNHKEVEVTEFLKPIESTILAHTDRELLEITAEIKNFDKFSKLIKTKSHSEFTDSFDVTAFAKIARTKDGTPAVTTLIKNDALFFGKKEISRGKEFGTYAHHVMEVLCNHIHAGITTDIDLLLTKVAQVNEYEIKRDDKTALKTAIDSFMKDDLAKTIKLAKSITTEITFAIPGVLHGIIDLLVEKEDGELLVVDFKTDVLGNDERGQKIKEHYTKQIDLYVESLLKVQESGVVGECFYLFGGSRG